MTAQDIFSIAMLALPICIILYFTIANNLSVTYSSISNFKNQVLMLYFSQYHPFFHYNILNDLTRIFLFLLSWVLIVGTTYIIPVFFASYIYNLNIEHPDTLYLLTAISISSVRFLIFKEGRQKSEVFSWIVSVFLIAWLIICYLTTFYDILKPLVIKYNLPINQFFTNEYNIKQQILNNLPTNPIIIGLGFLSFLYVEFICYSPFNKTIFPSKCGAWTLCHESNVSVERIIGRNRVREKAISIIRECDQERGELLWVTTIAPDKIIDFLKQCSNINNSRMVILNNPGDCSFINNNAQHKILCKKVQTDFTMGFMIRSNKELLITTTSINLRGKVKPFIGFYTKDIFLIEKYKTIFNELYNL